MHPIARRLQSLLMRVDAVLARCRFGVATLFVLYLGALVARASLWLRYRGVEVRPFNLNTEAVSLWGFLGCGTGDLLWAAGVGLTIALIERLIGSRSGAAVAVVVIFVSGVVVGTHIELIFTMHTGFSWVALIEFLSAPAVGEISDFVDLVDIAALLLSQALLVAVAGGPQVIRRVVVVVVVVVVGVVSLLGAFIPVRAVHTTLKSNGCVFLAEEVAARFGREGKYEHEAALSSAQQQTLRLIDPVFAAEGEPSPAPLQRTSAPPPTSVLFIVLESTGFEYLSERRPDGSPLMPELEKRAGEGVWFEQHRSTSNSSASSLFSIFTGLHPVPEGVVYAIRDEVRLPSFPSLWSKDVESFLITPGELESFFPRPLLRHAGLQEMWGYYNLPAEAHGTVQTSANRDERAVFRFFLDRLGATKGPSFAVYYTFAPHFDYLDYGERYRIITGIKNTKKRGYLNNLILIDDLLGQLFRQLEDTGKLKDTLVVIVGDHGEAFGRHKRNWAHSRASYEENFRVPLLMLHPSLAPGHVTLPTSHVDIAPTILDLVGVDAGPMQGRSLLQPVPPRRLMAWGNEGHLSSWTGPGARHKTQIDVYKDTCRVWDLAKDPLEKKRGPCTADDDDDVAALLAWRTHAKTVLKPLNAHSAH